MRAVSLYGDKSKKYLDQNQKQNTKTYLINYFMHLFIKKLFKKIEIKHYQREL